MDRLERWKRSLLDLTLRNRLLDAREGTRCVSLAGVDPVALAAAVDAGAALAVTAIGDSSAGAPAGLALTEGRVLVALAPDELARRLAVMSRALREGLAEGGTHTLWLGLGALRWVDDDGASHRAPLALVPVTLARPGAGAGWTIAAAADDARRNDTLVEKLRLDFGIAMAAPPEDEDELAIGAAIERFAAACEGRTGWGVEHTACLGIFSFAKLVMWTDLEERGASLVDAGAPVARHLAVADGSPFADQGPFPAAAGLDAMPVADTILPLDSDASQLAAALAGADGKTFVLQGPPGTGKSQTIANLIALAIGRGKTVLFVSEKMAALEVVEARLQQVGLAGACLELHSHKARKKDVIDALGKVLRGSWRPASGATGDDERLAALRAALDGHVTAMHETGPLGLSLHGALARLVELRDAARITLARAEDPSDAVGFAGAKDAIADYARAAAVVMPVAEHAWRASTLATWSLGAPDEIAAVVKDVAAAADEMIACLKAWSEAVPGFGARTSAELDAAGAMWTIAAKTPRPGAELITAAPESGPAEQGAVPERLALAKARAQTKALAKSGPPRDVIAWLVAARLEADLAARLAARWTDALDGLDLDALAMRFRRWAGRFALFRWFMLRGARAEMRRVLARGALPDDGAIATDLEAAIEERRVRRALDDVRPQAARWLGTLAPPADASPDLEKVDAAILWATELRAAFDAASVYRNPSSSTPVGGDRVAREAAWKALVAQVAAQPGTVASGDDALLRRSAAAYATWRTATAALAAKAGVETSAFDREPDGAAAAIARAAAAWAANVPALRDWAAYVRARTGALARGLTSACDACAAGAIAPSELANAWERATVLAWAESAAAARGLGDFHGAAHHARVVDFADLDRGSLAVARARLAAKVAERVPRADQDPSGEIAVLVRETKKQRGHRPLRRLFRDIPTLLPRLKPCLLMSPLSVAQYLDPSLPRFDLVIFDEASQIPTADAVGALARGTAAVVVGDSKQLPPTRFFDSAAADDDPDDELAELESVLDECVAARLPELHLRWHYRSRHEDLIAFSNARYYDDLLHVFPAAAAKAGDRDLGVELRSIEGAVYDRGGTRTNRVEAEAVVAEIAARVRADGKRTLGVVTFSRPQQALVEDLLDLARAGDAALDEAIAALPEPLIIKNLETVQGDERDVVLLSVGYGPDASGEVTMNFGPLNANGGERRLNVAVTRAREKLVVLSSIAPEVFDPMDAKGASPGVRHLGELLAYARAHGGAAPALAEATPAAPVSAIAAAIAAALEGHGWKVRHQVGCAGYRIDLAVVDPDDPTRYVLAIETDGAAYAQAPTARDRDRLRALVLGGLGWRLLRVWALDWWSDPDKEAQRAHTAVIAAVAAARQAHKPRVARASQAPVSRAKRTTVLTEPPPTRAAGVTPVTRVTPPPAIAAPPPPPETLAPPEPATPLAVGSSPTPAPSSATALAMPSIGRYIAASVPAGRRPADHVYEDRYTDEVATIIGVVLAAEAPVHFDLLARRVGAYFGIGRVTQKLADRLRDLIGDRGVFGSGADKDVVWRADQDRAALPAVRVCGDAAESKRDIEEVPVAEMAAAASIVLHRTAGGPPNAIDDLIRDTARLLGFARVTDRIAKRVKVGVDALAKRGGVKLEKGIASLPA